MLVLAVALAADPVSDARAALAEQRPHTLVFLKESTQEPVLEVTYNGPREASAVAFSPDGTFSVSVDATHMRVRLADGSCASVDARAAFEEARRAALDLAPRPGPPGSQLVYRVRPIGGVDLSTQFEEASDPPIFSWIADLGRDDVEVSTTKTSWEAKGPTSSWTIARDTGHLTRMTVGDDAMVLDRVRPEVAPMMAEPKLPRAASICPEPTAPALQRMFTSQIRLYAAIGPLGQLAEAWTGLDDAARADALDRQRAWWRAFYADDLPGWVASLETGAWRERVVADMADPTAFAGFRDQLPSEARAEALQHWKQAWFARVGNDLLSGHVAEVRQVVLDELTPEGEQQAALQAILAPQAEAALTEAEPLLQGVLAPVVEAGGDALLRAMPSEP